MTRPLRLTCALATLAVLALVIMAPVEAATILDPQNPSNFTRDGQQNFTAGTVLTLSDSSLSDYIAFFANDSDAGPGRDVDVVATFRVIQTAPNNADAGNRVVINDGLSRSAIAACVFIGGVRGIGLLSTGDPSAPASYPVFVPVDWQALTSVRLRRHASGDAEIMEVNGIAPFPRALLTAGNLAGNTRAGATVEFGAASLPAEPIIEYSAFRSELVPEPASGGIALLGMFLASCSRRLKKRCS
ncbi:MAG: hypothetical protein WD738_24470 [Pirellulales bacterium]